MFKNIKDKITLSGMTVLMIGVALLIATFISAYGFLTRTLSIMSSGELVGIFGGALAPLIETCIHIMYLGVMGWIGSLLTIRGVTIMANAPKMESIPPPQKPAIPQPKPIPQNAKKAEPQKEAKPEPEFVVIPPEQVVQPQPESKEPQKNNSSQQPANNQ